MVLICLFRVPWAWSLSSRSDSNDNDNSKCALRSDMSEYAHAYIRQELCKELSEINLFFNPPPCFMKRQLLLLSIVRGKPRPGELHFKPRKQYHFCISLNGLTSSHL